MEGLIFGGAYVRKEICVSKSIGLACSGKEFTIFALFYFVFEGKFQVQVPPGAYIRRGDLTEGFLRYDFGGLMFGGAYFRNFTLLYQVVHPWLRVVLVPETPCNIISSVSHTVSRLKHIHGI